MSDIRQRQLLHSTVRRCPAWVYLGACAAAMLNGCTSEAHTPPKHMALETPPAPGLVARKSGKPAMSPGDRPSPTEPMTDQDLTGAEKAVAFASRHVPYVKGQCESCHNSASSESLRPDFMAACQECHELHFAYHRFGHAPTVVGACRFCHSMHASQHEALLWAPQTDLCMKCHPTQQDKGSSSGCHRLTEAIACTACHDPHSAENQLLLEPGKVRQRAGPGLTRGRSTGARG